MGKKKKASLSEVKHAQIVILHKEGQSECLISENVECSKTAVHQAIVKFKICGSYVDTKRSGRPRKTTPRDDHLIQRVAVRSPTSSCNKYIYIHNIDFGSGIKPFNKYKYFH